MKWKNYKLPLIAALCLVLNGSYLPREKGTIIPTDRFYSIVPAAMHKGILISCIKCNCFNRVMDRYSATHAGMYIATDTNCNKLAAAAFVSQAGIDRISDDFYNVVLFRKENKGVRCRIVETAESSAFDEICSDFFK